MSKFCLSFNRHDCEQIMLYVDFRRRNFLNVGISFNQINNDVHHKNENNHYENDTDGEGKKTIER